MDQNNTKLDVRFNTPSDIQKIRCPFTINANARNTKAYLIRVEANYKSAIAAAIPMLAPPNEVAMKAQIKLIIQLKQMNKAQLL